MVSYLMTDVSCQHLASECLDIRYILSCVGYIFDILTFGLTSLVIVILPAGNQ